MEQPNIAALHRQLRHLGVEPDAIDRLMRTFDVEAFARIATQGAPS
jgi:hypothetical protein